MEQDVEPSPALVDGPAERIDILALGEIQRDQGGPLAGARLDLVVQRLQRPLGPPDGDDMGAGLG
jgi:hypothetical protein